MFHVYVTNVTLIVASRKQQNFTYLLIYNGSCVRRLRCICPKCQHCKSLAFVVSDWFEIDKCQRLYWCWLTLRMNRLERRQYVIVNQFCWHRGIVPHAASSCSNYRACQKVKPTRLLAHVYKSSLAISMSFLNEYSYTFTKKLFVKWSKTSIARVQQTV